MVVYKKLMNSKTTLDDLRLIQPTVAKSLEDMLHYEADLSVRFLLGLIGLRFGLRAGVRAKDHLEAEACPAHSGQVSGGHAALRGGPIGEMLLEVIGLRSGLKGGVRAREAYN